jgi:hypothetical protein
MLPGGRMKHRHRERGQAVLATTIIISLVLLTLLTMLTQVQLGNRLVSRQLTYQGQAANAAQAGLVDALSWFRKQQVQPVKTFNPIYDASATPPINETEDTNSPNMGIVRNYQVSGPGRLMARYEVRKGIPAFSATGAGVVDVTNQKGRTNATQGSVWQLESIGYIWVQNDPANNNYDQSTNQVLSKQTFRTEIQKMSVNVPDGGAALFSANCDNVTIDTKTKIQGGAGIGVSCRPGGGLGMKNNGVVRGLTPTKTNSVAPYDIQAVFAVTPQELQGLADVNVTTVTDLPNPLPAMNLIIINGPAVFDNKRPLTGSGILVVYGDLTVAVGSNSNWSGVIYCTGNLVINEVTQVSGAIIAANNSSAATVAINSGTDISEADYDPAIISQINSQMGQYRFSRSKYWVGK